MLYAPEFFTSVSLECRKNNKQRQNSSCIMHKTGRRKKERKQQTQIRRCAHFLIGVSLGVQTHKCDLHAHALLSVASVSSRRESRAHRHSRRLETEPILSVIINYLTVDFTALWIQCVWLWTSLLFLFERPSTRPRGGLEKRERRKWRCRRCLLAFAPHQMWTKTRSTVSVYS